VLKEYDKSRPLDDVVNEASSDVMPDEDEVSAPDKQGLFVLRRSNCLELLDPFGDALVVGDANLTFSSVLAKHRKVLSHAGHTVATTFEKLDTLKERYAEIDDTIRELEDNEAEVMHNVDCTRMVLDPRFQGKEGKFGAVYYNFPHAGVVQGFYDGHPFVRWRHANLMFLFFRELRSFVKPDGSVKVSSNSRATGVRFSDIIDGAKASEFEHVETFPFLEWQLANYRRSYGDRRDATKRPEEGQVYNDQRGHSDMVYCFKYKPSGETLPPVQVTLPPTQEELLLSPKEGNMGNSLSARQRKVKELWNLFLTYNQGIHVG